MATVRQEAVKAAGAAGVGAVTGAGIYGVIGGVGVATGGTAIGITAGPFIAIGAGIALAGYGMYWLGTQIGSKSKDKKQ